jgi:outer membrane protein OmpA-like peptidoglycan-associated protein
MKKALITATLIATFAVNINQAHAAASAEENVGFFSGAVTGAAVGGPIGFIIGGVAGALLGEQVEKANELDATVAKLEQQSNSYQLVENELNSMKNKVSEAKQELQNTSQWLTEGLSLELLFTTNSSEISERDQQVLQKLATLLVKFPQLKIRLDGFADPRGTQDANYLLSLSRAEAVLNKLKELGIPQSRVLLTAHGEANAAKLNPSVESYAAERKVSIKFMLEQDSILAQN